MLLKVKPLYPDAIIPKYATKGAACFDLHAHGLDYETNVMGTGLAFAIPEGHVMLIFSRSGHGYKYGVRLANCVGVIDSDYRGEVSVKLTADSEEANKLIINPGDRIAQAMVIPVSQVTFDVVDQLDETERGTGGFGSTGK